MTGLLEHAAGELERSGLGERTTATVVAVLRVLLEHGGKPGELSRLLDLAARLVLRQPLSALTRHPLEWNDVSSVVGSPMWQSARDSRAFSTDGGRTYTYQDDELERRHESVLPAGWVQALCERHYLSYQDAIAAVQAYFDAEQMTVEDVAILDSAGSVASRREFMRRRWPGQATLVAAMLYDPPEDPGVADVPEWVTRPAV